MQRAGGASLGHLLRRWRAERGVTQEELAEQVGISSGSLSALERDRARPRRYTLDRLLAELALPPEAAAEIVQAWRTGGQAAPYPLRESSSTEVPRPLTSFVGRRRALSDTQRLLSDHRMLTLTGVGGVGKTRLALQLASNTAGDFPGGVYVADLAVISEPGLVPFVILAALGLLDTSPGGAVAAAIGYLKERQALLVLDNCEHLVEATADLASHLLTAAPELRVLATSRRPLGVAIETTYSVATLGLARSSTEQGSNHIRASEAVQLFVERAAVAVPTFQIDERNVDRVSVLCEMLDGLPLAIELAVVRLRSLGLDDMLERLTYRLDLLRGTGPAFRRQQQTLRAVLDWSHDLLGTAEQRLFRSLAVFQGDFDLNAVEVICSDPTLPGTAVLVALTGLVEQSLVSRVEGSGSRYRLLDTVRQYAWEKLRAANEVAQLERRHRDRYADFARAMRAAWWGPRQRQTLDQLDLEHANLRAALDRCLPAPSDGADLGLAMCCDLFVLWQWGSHLGEGRQYVSALLERCPTPNAVRAEAQALAGFMALMQGDDGQAEAWLRESAEAAQRFGAVRVRLQALAYLGMLASARARYAHAEALLGEALVLATTHDRTWLPRIQHLQADLALDLGQPDRAAGLLEESIAECDLAGERWVRQRGLALLGLTRAQLGRHGEAANLLGQALAETRLLEDWRGSAMCLDGLAWTAGAGRNYEAAARLLGAAHGAWQIGAGGVPSFWRHWHERCQREVEEALGADVVASAWHDGLAHARNLPASAELPLS
jgi:non-specific serine/threonine protein kinase